MTAKEAKKIKVAKERFNKMIDILSIEDIETINQALTEQQKKDELLELYRNKNKGSGQYDTFWDKQIKALEEELK